MVWTNTRMLTWLLVALLAGAPQAPQPKPDPAREGWEAIQRGDGDKAATVFSSVLSAHPNDSRALTGAGLAARLLGHDDQAVDFLKRAVEADPRNLDAAAALGRVAYATGDLAAAIAAFERVVKLAPGDTAAAEKLASWRKEAALHDTLTSQPTGRFTVMFEGETQQAIANRVSEVLEAAYYRVGKALNAYPPQTVTAILYTGQQFTDITKAPAWAGAAYDGRLRIPVGGAMKNPAELDRVVTHEFVHAVLHQVYPRIPKWLDEGVATYLEGGSHAALLTHLREGDKATPLAKMNEAFNTNDGADATVAYAQSFAGVRFLVERAGASFPVLLQYLSDGMSLEEALVLFNIDPAELEKAWSTRESRYERDSGATHS